jgi:sporulation protein YlmC with PRC-barrel domain
LFYLKIYKYFGVSGNERRFPTFLVLTPQGRLETEMETEMTMKKTLISVALATTMLSAVPAFAQTAAGVEPACMVKNADGTETVDKAKCPDGMKVGGASTTESTTTDTKAAIPSATDGTALIIPADSFTGAKIISANDFIGKRVYSKAGDDIGEVNDLIMTENGSIRAVILGVGGFLGMGEKDVAVSMNAINMAQDGNNVKLVVDGSKEQFNAAPKYDRSKRTYIN